jgi:hypothetical protein
MIGLAGQASLRRGQAERRLSTNERMQRTIQLDERLGSVETRRATAGGHRRVFMTKAISPAV